MINRIQHYWIYNDCIKLVAKKIKCSTSARQAWYFIILSNSFNKFNNSYPHNYVIFPMLILLQACLLDNGCSHGVVEQIGETSHHLQETFEPEEVSLGIQ